MTNLTKLTIPELFYHSVEKYHDRTSLVFTGEENHTYDQTRQEVERIALLLKDLGVKKGDRVAILSTNMPNWGKAFFAGSIIGAINVPILPDFHENEIRSILEHSESRILMVSENLYKLVAENCPSTVERIILMDNFALVPENTGVEELKELKSALPEGTLEGREQVEEDDLVSIIYTSGTTGNSKGVMLTHKNITWTARQSRTLQEVVPEDRFLSILPLSHTLENTVGFLLPFMYGASIHYLRKPPVASVLLPALQLVKPTVMLSVPLIIEKVFRTKILPKFQKSAFVRSLYSVRLIQKFLHRIAAKKLYETFGGKLRFFGIGGAKLDSNVERFLKDGKFPYAIGYGLTETSPILAGAVGKNRRVGSTGLAMEGVSLRIANPDPLTGEGEIQAMGANVMRGYYKSEELTNEVFTSDGWFKTGDRGMFDSKNRLFIKGRIKTMIVGASGENIYPEEIETVINKMRFVLESLVLEKKGKLVAMIHLNMEEVEENFKHLKDEAKSFVHEKMEEVLNDIHQKVNDEVNKFSRIQKVVLQPIPFEKTPTKKIKRFLYV